MNLVPAVLRRIAFLLRRRLVLASLQRGDRRRVLGLHLVVPRGVLHPGLFGSSQILGRHIMTLDLRGLSVLDLGSGSGLLALLAARAGAVVTAIDINPTAVACVMENARNNGVDDAVTALVSDVFGALPPGQVFDLLITNPPFYRREPLTLEDRAFAAGADFAFFAKLSEGLPRRLKDGGSLLLIHSSDEDLAPVAAMLLAAGFDGRKVLEKRGFFETLTIEEFRRSAPL